MFCKACGAKVPDGTLFCSACGRPMNMPAGKTGQNLQEGKRQTAQPSGAPAVPQTPPAPQTQPVQASQQAAQPLQNSVPRQAPVPPVQPMKQAPPAQPMQQMPPAAPVRPSVAGGTPIPAAYYPPVPEKKSGSFKVVLAGMLSLLFLAVLGVGVYGFTQGWFDFSQGPEQLDEPETTEATRQTQPVTDPTVEQFQLVEHQWEGVTLFLREDMSRYHWDVDYINYYGDSLEVVVDSYVCSDLSDEITSSRSFAEAYKEIMAADYRQIGVYNAGEVYYTRGVHGSSGLYEVVAFYMAGDYAYSVSVYNSDPDQMEEMVRIATTATVDTSVKPQVPAGGVERKWTKEPVSGNLTLHLLEEVRDDGFYEGGIGYKNDWMTLRIDSGSMEEGWVDFEDAAGLAESCRGSLETLWDQVSVSTMNGRSYVLCQDADGYTCVLGCYVKDGVWWEVWLYSYTDRMAQTDMIRAVTSATLN